MMLNPRKGQRVQCWYNKKFCHLYELHGKIGTVVIPSRGKPRNHGVMIDGRFHVVPCGNLNKAPG